jgi:hypothetical protein
MLDVAVEQDHIRIGNFSFSFQRTLRIPDYGRTYPLPPGLGTFPVLRVEDYQERVPEPWKEHGGVFIPMFQREATWLAFNGAYWRPNAVQIAIGKVNVVTGKPWKQSLGRTEQDYIVVPDQPWLDGINAGDGLIRQFVAMPLGMGYTVEGQVTGKEEFGGIQIICFEPKRGLFPSKPPERDRDLACFHQAVYSCTSDGAEMGLGAGGKMKQKIYPDPHGIDTWSQRNFGRVYIHIVNSMMYREITGLEPPPTPISAKMYTEYGFPWFDLYDEGKGDLGPSDVLAGVKSVKEKDKEKGSKPQQDDSPVQVPNGQVKKLKAGPVKVKNGSW